MAGRKEQGLTMRRWMCRMLVFALTLSLLLIPLNVKKAHAFDWIDPPYPGAADGWYETKSGKYQLYQGEYLPVWPESSTEYELNDAGQVIKATETYGEDAESTSITYYEYDSEGRVSRYYSDGDTDRQNYQYVYDYKDDGTIVTTETWDWENSEGETQTRKIVRTHFPSVSDMGWYMGEWHCTFDSKGRLVHRWTDSGSDWTCTYEEDAQGRTVKGTIVLDHAGFERVYTYNDDGGWTMRESSKTGYEEFTFNKNGQLIQYVNAYGEGPMAFNYTYDKAGNNISIESDMMRWAFEYVELPKPADPGVSFEDVPDNAYFAEPVKWAVENGITNGLGKTRFGPDETCTRGQMVTFLWRAAGEPEPTITENPFVDVKEKDYYYKAVLWALEKKITEGTSKNTFSPNNNVLREQTVTFLWRSAGQPAEGSDNPFVDVPEGAYYTKAVLWAVKNDITKGMEAELFGVGVKCTRAQIVTFLYRAQ